MAPRISPIQTLVGLAEKDRDEASKRLGLALRAVEDNGKKLTMLFGYRDDYLARLQNAQQAGITPMEYRNFQAFLAKLDNAINGQQEALRGSERRAEQERAHLQECERKRMSYSILVDRAQKEQDRRDAKREQRQSDEFASRQAFFKR